MASALILCNLEALAVAGNGKMNISHYKNPALGWNTFKFSAPLHSPQKNPQLKTVKRSRGGYGPCKVYVQCHVSKERGSPKERKRIFGISPEKAIPIILDCLKALHRPAMIAILVGLLVVHDPEAAMAASGGRMGGKSFSSGRGSGSYSSRTFSAPSPSFSYSVPYAAPSPFGFGGGLFVRPAYGIGFGASSGIFLLIMGFLAVVFVSGFLSDRADTGLFVSSQKTSVLKLQVGLLGLARSIQKDLDQIAETANTSTPEGLNYVLTETVLALLRHPDFCISGYSSVGLLGLARSIQKDLDQIAETANTSTPEGLNYVLTETVLALLRHPDFCISGYSSVDFKRSIEAGEERFNQLSIEERGKFNEETLVNISGIRKRSTGSQRSDVFSNEYIVITVVVAAEGEHKIPVINSSADLKEALKKLGSIPSHQTLAVEVLWTPQNENDTLSERDLLQDYPLLRPL
uniref:Uncharacterized protein n=1 Tax=Picea sitchensis TaxID=3332 RepID=B8LK86_PICSI|nr:unknown [Picea sitchensis]